MGIPFHCTGLAGHYTSGLIMNSAKVPCKVEGLFFSSSYIKALKESQLENQQYTQTCRRPWQRSVHRSRALNNFSLRRIYDSTCFTLHSFEFSSTIRHNFSSPEEAQEFYDRLIATCD